MNTRPEIHIPTARSEGSKHDGPMPADITIMGTGAALPPISHSLPQTGRSPTLSLTDGPRQSDPASYVLNSEHDVLANRGRRSDQPCTTAQSIPSRSGAPWLVPHGYEHQKHDWYYVSLGMGTKYVHDEWGFSSANVSRSHSPCHEEKEEKET
jgi:hypothetical protein